MQFDAVFALRSIGRLEHICTLLTPSIAVGPYVLSDPSRAELTKKTGSVAGRKGQEFGQTLTVVTETFPQNRMVLIKCRGIKN
ncbi:MAG: hypothetical protein AAF802_31880 [Planctomycetota bacterium]